MGIPQKFMDELMGYFLRRVYDKTGKHLTGLEAENILKRNIPEKPIEKYLEVYQQLEKSVDEKMRFKHSNVKTYLEELIRVYLHIPLPKPIYPNKITAEASIQVIEETRNNFLDAIIRKEKLLEEK